MVSLWPLHAQDSTVATQLHAPLQVVVFFLEGTGNWAAFIRCISSKSVERLVQVISALSALSFIQQHQVLGSCHGFAPLFLITVQHLSQTAWFRCKETRHKKWIKKKHCPSKFPLCCAITEPHHCRGCWGVSSSFELMQQHRSWQATALLSPLGLKPLTPSLRRPLCPVPFPRSCLVAEAE